MCPAHAGGIGRRNGKAVESVEEGRIGFINNLESKKNALDAQKT